jgi:hypothetical protein
MSYALVFPVGGARRHTLHTLHDGAFCVLHARGRLRARASSQYSVRQRHGLDPRDRPQYHQDGPLAEGTEVTPAKTWYQGILDLFGGSAAPEKAELFPHPLASPKVVVSSSKDLNGEVRASGRARPCAYQPILVRVCGVKVVWRYASFHMLVHDLCVVGRSGQQIM